MHAMITRRTLIMSGVGLASLVAAHPAGAEPFEVSRSDAEWRGLLSPEQYSVLRQSGTERPFTSPLLHEKRRGTYACAGCDLDLFSSTTKYDSRTGWPSFWAPLDRAVETSTDTSYGTVRTAVHCHRCGGHLGHVFEDGPRPTGLRYCMNGVAMTFKPLPA
jgi:peptide-methionine (R)-S-oxide reductase